MADQNSPDIFELKEDAIRLQARMEEVDKVESRLGARIQVVKSDLRDDIQGAKKDLHDRITRLETRLQWSVTIAIGVTGIVVVVIVKFV